MVYIWPKALVEVLINYLSLAISLWVVHCRELQLHTYAAAELVPEVRDELGASIGHNRLWHADVPHNMRQEQWGKLSRSYSIADRN